MAEEWLKKLAKEIKETDHDDAERALKEREKGALIVDQGGIYWRSFGDFLGNFIEELKADLGESPTLKEGAISFSVDRGTQNISIKKAAYPYVSFWATANLKDASASVNYSSVNPVQINSAAQPQKMPCRFEISHHGKVFLQLDGQSFHEPNEAAKYVMEKLFTIS